jgi:hypothetical protein
VILSTTNSVAAPISGQTLTVTSPVCTGGRRMLGGGGSVADILTVGGTLTANQDRVTMNISRPASGTSTTQWEVTGAASAPAPNSNESMRVIAYTVCG